MKKFAVALTLLLAASSANAQCFGGSCGLGWFPGKKILSGCGIFRGCGSASVESYSKTTFGSCTTGSCVTGSCPAGGACPDCPQCTPQAKPVQKQKAALPKDTLPRVSVCTLPESTTVTRIVCNGNQCQPVRDTIRVAARTVANILAAPKAAIDQVNAMRAARGMQAYVYDEGLYQAALACATARAQAGTWGHTRNDFVYLPSGVTAKAAGCNWEPVQPGGRTFYACAVYDNYTYCGAAVVTGPDGKEYHHAFYR